MLNSSEIMPKKEKVGAVIVAAGSSRRMDGQDKIFSRLGRESVLATVIHSFHDSWAIDQIVVVLSEENLSRGRKLIAAHDWPKVKIVCAGGVRRQDSVKNGLAFMPICDWVMIHDGARPFVDDDLIERGLAAAQETGAAVAAVPVTDTIKKSDAGQTVVSTLDREKLWNVQTPQVFRFDIICEAYTRVQKDVTDDAALVEKIGGEVKLFMGSYENIKITTPRDLQLARIITREMKS